MPRAPQASAPPPPKADESPWQRHSDPASGASYWHNPVTGESSWLTPASLAKVSAAAAPRPSMLVCTRRPCLLAPQKPEADGVVARAVRIGASAPGARSEGIDVVAE